MSRIENWASRLALWDAAASSFLRVDHHPVLKRVAAVAAHLGDGPIWLVLWVAGIIFLPSPRRWQVLVWLLASAVATVITHGIKFALKRPRPSEKKGFYSRSYDQHAFPSGHATRMGTLPIMGAWIFPELAPLFWAISLACIWARAALGIHFLGDVVAGWLIGAGVSIVALWAAMRWL